MTFYHNYRWLLPSLVFSVLLIGIRVMYTLDLTFAFLLWNLFLAVLPLYFSYRMKGADGRGQWCLACLWLLFFPNSMYIVTDMFHLRERMDMPLWYDLLLLLSAAINGVIMGFLSLCNAERWMKTRVNKRYVPVVIFGLLLLCGYGIYLGRYLRWNSWDVVTQPFGLATDILYHIIHPWRNREVWMLSLLFAVWMKVMYHYVKQIRHWE